MSVKFISAIMETEIRDGIAKLVAMVLADYADSATGRCWPRIPTLARQCSQSERTIQRKLRLLEELGLLRVEPNTSGNHKGNVYVLLPHGSSATSNVKQTGDTQSSVPTGGRPSSHPTGDTGDTPRVTLRSPPKNPPRESVRESYSEPNGSGAGEPAPKAKKPLFSEGRTALIALGLSDRQAGSMIGRWLRDTGEDVGRVLHAIRLARDQAPHDPIPWITAHLTSRNDYVRQIRNSDLASPCHGLAERIRALV